MLILYVGGLTVDRQQQSNLCLLLLPVLSHRTVFVQFVDVLDAPFDTGFVSFDAPLSRSNDFAVVDTWCRRM